MKMGEVSKNANLSHESNDVATATEVVKNTPVYNIPRTWIDQLNWTLALFSLGLSDLNCGRNKNSTLRR